MGGYTGAQTELLRVPNITHFTLDLVDVLIGRDPDTIAAARLRASATWPPIAGFAIGCGIGAVCEAAFAMRALMLSLSLVFFALMLSRMGRARAA